MQLSGRNKGFSLIELLVAVAVMSIIMVMVVQMMGNSSVILRKTNKKLELQTEALEFREQFSDIIMQATYIRAESGDNSMYRLDTNIDASNHNNRKRTALFMGVCEDSLVSDNYPNYTVAGDNGYDIYMNDDDYTLYCIDSSGTKHESGSTIQSFRKLLDGANAGEPRYIKPTYVYVRYQRNNAAKTERYAIFRFVADGGKYKVYVAKGTINNIDTAANDGFSAAKTAVDAKATAAGDDGLMSDKVKDVYFSADSLGNTVFIDMQFENATYIRQTYEYRDTISLRNSYALTVPPSKMFKKTTP